MKDHSVRKILIVLAAFLLLLFLARVVCGAEIKQSELEFAEPQSYTNSLCLGELIEESRGRLFRCGDVVRLKSNPEQLAIVFNYRRIKGKWVYTLRRAHYVKQ